MLCSLNKKKFSFFENFIQSVLIVFLRLSQFFPDPRPPLPIHTTLCPFFPTKTNSRCPNVLGCTAFHWSTVNQPAAILAKESDSPSPNSQQLPRATWPGLDFVPRFPLRAGVSSDLALHRQRVCSYKHKVYMYGCPAVLRRHCFLALACHC